MWKLFLTPFLVGFVNEILTSKVGIAIFKGKGVITASGPHGTTLYLNLGTNCKYEITVKKI